MTFDEAEKIAKELGYEIHCHNGNRTWFQALTKWDFTGQTISLQVWPESEEFELSRMEGAIQITTGKCGSFRNLTHFMSWQRNFMQLIERLA